jgi:hypothetical protein
MVVDLFLVYQFIRRLVTPFEKWEAYKEGVIDAKGNILVKRKDFTRIAQRKAFGIFDILILNLKKLLAKLPGGSTRIATYAAALWLIKEERRMNDAGVLTEDYELDDIQIENRLHSFLDEYAEVLEEASKNEMTGVGSGAIAGLGVGDQGEPGLTPAQQKKYKKKNFKQLMVDIKAK